MGLNRFELLYQSFWCKYINIFENLLNWVIKILKLSSKTCKNYFIFHTFYYLTNKLCFLNCFLILKKIIY